ncbi:hypothetical protein, partial [Psychrobacillus psychrotolerans]|uniref:phage lytic cycle repressor MrpR family protein n=1 Tax=Psychrobacillus psychrotolerans TaxID=126156 RepID=UPI003C7581CD
TRTTMFFSLRNATKTERQLNKDLYEMNIDELSVVLSGAKSSTISSVHNYIMSFSRYIDWAYRKGLAVRNINPLSQKDHVEWGRQFVTSYMNTILTREQIIDMLQELANEIDQAVLLALFEGISGEGFSELLNLKMDDIDEEDGKYFANLKDQNGDKRTIEISERLHKLLQLADTQTEYINKNENGTLPQTLYSQLYEGDRIFKKSKRGKVTEDNLLTHLFVNRKFNMFKKVFDNHYLNARDIKKSGICHLAYTLYGEKGKLETEDFIEIGNHYDTIWTSTKGKRYRNVTAIKKILNSDIAIGTYKVDMTKTS